MNKNMISELFISDTSEYGKIEEECVSLQNGYYEKIVRYINNMKQTATEEYVKETSSFLYIQKLIESDIFKHLIENNRFREKVQHEFEQEYVLGCSYIGLIKMTQNIEELCRLYTQHYEKFSDEALKQVEKETKKMSAAEQKEVMEITRNNICTYNFFNLISNANG